MTNMPLLLLASNSPRRRQLLALGGWTFDVDVANVDESLLPGEAPADYVRRLAESKARAVLPRAQDEHVIVGADTTVVIDDEILGKPVDEAEARQMLIRLRGRTHQVFTGISVLRASDGNQWTEVVVTDVPMRAYSDEEIERYIASGDPMDKAGSYGIQNPDFQPVANMAGCYASVMGLPVCGLSILLRQAGIAPRADVGRNCQSTLAYQCPVVQSLLRGNPPR
jgi:septum formation protein